MLWFFSILLLFLSQFSFSQVTTIKGHSPEYAGTPVVFYGYIERIFNTRNKVFEIIPDAEGHFKANFQLNETKYLFAEAGDLIYFFYAEPNKSYHITLPIPQEKSQQNLQNPYFIPSEIHLIAETYDSEKDNDCQDINDAIREYDKAFIPFYDTQLLLYHSPVYSRERLDSFQLTVMPEQTICNEDYYSLYRFYNTGLLEFTVNQFNINELKAKYFENKPVSASVPSYWELFNKIFDKYFSQLTRKEEFKELYKYIASGDFTAIEKLLRGDPALMNDTIRELVLLKEINNEFHEGYFSKPILTSLLDSIALNSSSDLYRELSLYVKKRNTRLLPGSIIPELLLTDTSGNTFNITELSGKFIYLGFCNPGLIECQKEFEYLRYFHQNFKDRLIIITAFNNISLEELNKLAIANNYQWMLTLLAEPESAIRNFNIKALPMFYFIDHDNRFIESPANLPSAGFEKVLFRTLRSMGEKSLLE